MTYCKLTRGERFVEARKTYNKHGEQTQEAVEAALPITHSKLSLLESDEIDIRDIGHKDIIELAKYYGVSLDYLFGISDVTRPEADIKTAAKTTGLSGDAVEALHYISSHSSGDIKMDDEININLQIMQFLNKELESLAHIIREHNKKDSESGPNLTSLFFYLGQYINGPDDPKGIMTIPGFQSMDIMCTKKEISHLFLQKHIITILDRLYEQNMSEKEDQGNGKH